MSALIERFENLAPAKRSKKMKRLIILIAIALLPAVGTFAQPMKAKPKTPERERLHFHVPRDFSTIQAAIDRAADSYLIIVAPGTYEENINFLGKAIKVRSDLDGDPDTYDISPGDVVIDGMNLASVVTFDHDEKNDSVLDGFSLVNGIGNYDPSSKVHHGGGIYCTSASPLIINNQFFENAALLGNGGGIYCLDASPILQDNGFVKNIAVNGGGIYCEGDFDITLTNINIADCTVSNNGAGLCCIGGTITLEGGNFFALNVTANNGGGAYFNATDCEILEGNSLGGNCAYYQGGGICLQDCVSARVSGSGVLNNSASYGCGIACDNSTVVIENNEITNNWLPDGSVHYGGGLSCLDSSVEIRGNTINYNEAAYGGGIYAINSSGAIDNNIIRGNSAGDSIWGCGNGSGFHLVACNLTLFNNLIADNYALNVGGGIYCTDNTMLDMTNNTFTNNDVGNVGFALFSDTNCTITCFNCIVWQNSPTWKEMSIYATDLTLSYTDFEELEEGIYADPASTVTWGPGMKDSDPLFTAGTKGDYYLSHFECGQALDSPCVDSGDPASSLVDGTTRIDELPDEWPVDMGFHYPAEG
jgi:predicted outer membrane repeat protein